MSSFPRELLHAQGHRLHPLVPLTTAANTQSCIKYK
jgi:hypothetical protein